MNRILRWLAGYVEFEYSSGFVQGFVQDLYFCGISAFDIKTDNGCILAKCRLSEYSKVHRIAVNNGGKIKIIRKRGLIPPLLRLRSRMGLAVGALCFVLLICLLSGFIWQIDITGNERISTLQISTLLEDNGFTKGVYRKSVDKDYLESLLLATFEDIAWAHINYDGTTARVEISECIPKPEISNDDGIANIKATKDGIIVKNKAVEGWEVVQKGDSVVKGDLLISGVYQSDKENRTVFAHAKGEVLARVKEKVELTVNREQKTRLYTETKVYKDIYFFGIYIPLHFLPEKSGKAERESRTEYLMLNKFCLPIGIRKTRCKYYELVSKTLNDSELASLMNEEIKTYLSDNFGSDEIIGKKIDISLNAHNASAKGSVTVIENIGEEIEVKLSEKLPKKKKTAK